MPRHTSAERRDQIAGTLLSVMADHGYDGASVAEVASRIGINKGLVHHHFPTKVHVLVHAMGILAERHEHRLDAVMAEAGPSSWSRVEAYINAHLGLGSTADPEALSCWIDMMGHALRTPLVNVAFTEVLAGLGDRLQAIVQEGVASGEFTGDPAAATAAILATIQGYLVLAGTDRQRIPHGTAALSTIAMARGLLNPRSTK